MDKKSRKLVDKYSIPFVQLVLEKGEEDAVFEDLSQLEEVFVETGFVSFLKNVALDDKQREESLLRLKPLLTPLLQNFLEVVVANHRTTLFYEMLVDSLKRLERESNRFEVQLTSAYPLSKEQKQRLLPLAEKKFDLKVRRFTEVIDEELIGGFVMVANHKTIDSSIRQQLRVVKGNLK